MQIWWALGLLVFRSSSSVGEEDSDVFKDGQPVAHEHFPFIASLQEWGDRWVHICVANIVDKTNVVTSVQCVGTLEDGRVELKDPKTLRVYAGTGDLDYGSLVEQHIMVKNVTVHPKVSRGNGTVAFDVAALLLARELDFNLEILPMSLPAADSIAHSKALCYSPGWGGRWSERTSNLTLVEFKRIPHAQCSTILCRLFALCSEDFQEQGQTCASNVRSAPAFTELGSPLWCHGFVYGIATFKAGTNSPVVFTSLQPILDTVNQIAKLLVVGKEHNETDRGKQALNDKKRMEAWVRMLSKSQIHQATTGLIWPLVLALMMQLP